MTKDDIIRMAREAGVVIDGNNSGQDDLLYFAVLVAAAEREECAKIADGWPDYDVQGLAEEIRARGTT